MLILLLGFVSGNSLIGLIWMWWWHRERQRPLHCSGCHCFADDPV